MESTTQKDSWGEPWRGAHSLLEPKLRREGVSVTMRGSKHDASYQIFSLKGFELVEEDE